MLNNVAENENKSLTNILISYWNYGHIYHDRQLWSQEKDRNISKTFVAQTNVLQKL